MTIRKNKIIFSLIALVLILSIPFIAFAASYTSTLHFDTNLTGATRSYSAGNISVTVYNPSCTYGEYGTPVTQGSQFPSTYTVKLYRKNLIGYTYIGENTSMNRYYTSSTTWTNMISGNYYFSFTKAIDGVWITSSNVFMGN